MRQLTFLIMSFVPFLFTACADNGIPIGDLRGQVQGGAQRTAELVFTARDPIVALADNHRGVLYAATSTGDVYAVRDVNQAERLYRGLTTCQNSWTAFAVAKDGTLVANTCRGNQDVLITIDAEGKTTELARLADRVTSLAADSQGNIYIAAWQSEGNLSISLNPRSLAGAEFIIGRIYRLDQSGKLERIFEGGIPVWITMNRQDALVASVWGGRGYFAPERRTYSYVDPYRSYWLALSDKVKLVNVTEGTPRFAGTMIDSMTLFVMPEQDYLIGYGIAGEQKGLFLVEENRPPIKLLFKEEGQDANITCLTLFNNVVYFGNAEGHVFRIK